MTKLVFLAFLAMAVAIGEAANITVGGTTGWTVPQNTEFYDTWEDTVNITVGDTLVFIFTQGAHDVARVSEADYDSCNLNSPISTDLNSPFSFFINDTSDRYFICTFGTHCSRGQKLAITDVQPSSPSSSPSPPPPPPSTTNGPSSSATPPPPPPSTTNGPSSSATPPPPPPPPNAAHSLPSASSFLIVAVAVVLGLVRV